MELPTIKKGAQTNPDSYRDLSLTHRKKEYTEKRLFKPHGYFESRELTGACVGTAMRVMSGSNAENCMTMIFLLLFESRKKVKTGEALLMLTTLHEEL